SQRTGAAAGGTDACAAHAGTTHSACAHVGQSTIRGADWAAAWANLGQVTKAGGRPARSAQNRIAASPVDGAARCGAAGQAVDCTSATVRVAANAVSAEAAQTIVRRAAGTAERQGIIADEAPHDP